MLRMPKNQSGFKMLISNKKLKSNSSLMIDVLQIKWVNQKKNKIRRNQNNFKYEIYNILHQTKCLHEWPKKKMFTKEKRVVNSYRAAVDSTSFALFFRLSK